MNIKINKLIFVIAIFSIHLIPFAKSVSIETLPILLILFCFYIYLSTDLNVFNYIKNNELIFLLILYLVLFYATHFFGGYNNYIQLSKYLVGPVVFLFFTRIKKFFGIDELIFFGFFIIILFFIFQTRVPLIFNLSCNILEFFIARLECTTTGIANLKRSFLITPEPSYLSLLLSYYLIVLYYFKQKIINNNNKKKIISLLEISMLLIIFSTLSRIGVFFSIIYSLFYIIKLRKKIIENLFTIFVIFFFITLFLSYNQFSLFSGSFSKFGDEIYLLESRQFLNIDRIVEHYAIDNAGPAKSLLAIINNFEPTGFIRILHNYLSVVGSIKNNFIGNGLGSYADVWYQYVIDKDMVHLVRGNEVMMEWYPDILSKKQYVQNYMFSMLHDGGLIPIILIFTIMIQSVKKMIKNKNYFGLVILGYLSVSFFFQSSISSPYPWLALAMLYYDDEKYA